MNICNWFILLQAWFTLVSGRVYNIGIGISHTFRNQSQKVYFCASYYTRFCKPSQQGKRSFWFHLRYLKSGCLRKCNIVKRGRLDFPFSSTPSHLWWSLRVLLSRSIEIGPFGTVQYRCKVHDQSRLLLGSETRRGYQWDPTHWLWLVIVNPSRLPKVTKAEHGKENGAPMFYQSRISGPFCQPPTWTKSNFIAGNFDLMREEKARRRVESRTMHWWDEGASLAEIGSFDVYVDLVLVPPPFSRSVRISKML